MFIGECTRCGKCCLEAWRFQYVVVVLEDGTWDLNTLSRPFLPVDADKVVAAENQVPCTSLELNPVTHQATCAVQADKSYICSGWPFGREDLIFPECGIRWIPEPTSEEVIAMKYTTLICSRKDGTTKFSESALQDIAATANGMLVRKTINGPVIGRVTRAWVDSEGVHAEVTLEEDSNLEGMTSSGKADETNSAGVVGGRG